MDRPDGQMTPTRVLPMDRFNESHRRRLLANAQYADKLIADIEGILSASESKSPFPKYRPDLPLHQARLVRSHLQRFRDHLSKVLAALGIQYEGPQMGALHSIRVTLTFIRIAVQEMAPEHLRGYGEVPEQAASELRGVCTELEGLIDAIDRSLTVEQSLDVQARLARLEQTGNEAELLRILDRVITEDELAEYRAPLVSLVERLEAPRFEIAVFGRVSSGKSSLLNHLLDTDVLPVGVNPITTVPTRLVYGEPAGITVTLDTREVQQHPIERLVEFASEERNPGNELGVTKLVVALPSARLKQGLVLVDTPGLGALATAGAEETRSYLPQCDLGILLVSAVTPIDDEDLSTLNALTLAGVPVMVLLSKADLLSPGDRLRAADYTRREVSRNLQLNPAVYPVSIVGKDETLLREWFRQELEPLLRRHHELALESTRRKAGALREAVIAALRLKLDGTQAVGWLPPTVAQDVETVLRTAAGELEAARHFCIGSSDAIRLLRNLVLERSVDEVLASWDSPPDEARRSSEAVQRTITHVATEAASPVATRLTDVAHRLQAALEQAAALLGDAGFALEQPLEACIREMPRFEAALPEFPLTRPRFAATRALARHVAANQLRRLLSPALDAALGAYGRAMEAWVRRVLAELQERFDAKADGYRAQLARMSSRKSLSADQRARLLAHLRLLESTLPNEHIQTGS